MRIAMWSGPRNLSTALMYSFGNRSDMHVMDEPFYGPYLRRTGLPHPMRDAIIASRPESEAQVVDRLLGPLPAGKSHAYQKHMCQHMIDGIPREWIPRVTNVFLIRHPARVLASFSSKYDDATLADTGFLQQAELFDQLVALGVTPVVIDSADIRADPERMLRNLCAAIDLPFDPAMLSWPRGGHPADGVWAKVWYGSVHNSTGFAGPEGPLPVLSGRLADWSDAALPHYLRLRKVRIR